MSIYDPCKKHPFSLSPTVSDKRNCIDLLLLLFVLCMNLYNNNGDPSFGALCIICSCAFSQSSGVHLAFRPVGHEIHFMLPVQPIKLIHFTLGARTARRVWQKCLNCCTYIFVPQLRGKEAYSEQLQLRPAAVIMVTKFDKIFSGYQTCQFLKDLTSDPDDGNRDGSRNIGNF
jgi:hypothetical protein